jgi:hypothetical protein
MDFECESTSYAKDCEGSNFHADPTVETFAAIERLAKRLKTTKTSVVVTLLNEALAMAQKKG